MKYPALIALTLSLGACASSGVTSLYASLPERRQAPPQVTYASTMNPAQVRDCMVERLADYKQLGVTAGDAATTPYGEGWTVRSATSPTAWFADITPVASGSTVKIWVAARFPEGLRTRLTACT